MSRREYSAQYKTKLVLEVLHGEKELGTIAYENNINPNMLRNWNSFAPVVVCGGEVGGETAEFIAETAFNVTLLEMQPAILNDMVLQNKMALLELLAKKNVRIITDAKVSKITENSVKHTDASGNEVELPAAVVVSAFGYKAYNPLEEVARKNCGEIYVVGSAVKAGNALVAMKEGYEAGLAV